MIKIGKIVGSFGIKGELKLFPYTNDLEMFFNFDELYYLSKSGEYSKLVINNIRQHKNMFLLTVEGITTIEEGQYLIEKDIFIEESSLPKLNPEESYVFQLLDCQVYSAEGEYLGLIKDVFSNGAHDIYVVEHEGQEVLIPIIPEVLISKDIINKIVTLKVLPGLLD